MSVAREFGVHSSQVFRWRQQLCGKTAAPLGFAAVAITAEPREPASAPCGLIEIELGTGTRIRISGAVDAATMSAVMAALAPRAR
jgi:transposase